MLLAAYLSSDLFRPLKQLEAALGRAARGDFGTRLDTERRDEFGAVNRAFNTLGVATQQRGRGSERPSRSGPAPQASEAPSADGAEGGDAQTSRRTLHQLVGRLRGRVAEFSRGADAPQQRALLADIDGLVRAVTRLTEVGFPLDLTLAETDLRTLLYKVALQVHE